MITAHLVLQPEIVGDDSSPVIENRRKRTLRKPTSQPKKSSSRGTRSVDCSTESYEESESLNATIKKRKKQVKQACAGCKKAHTRCEDSRPCARCKSMKVECVDAPRKKRKRRDFNEASSLSSEHILPTCQNEQGETTHAVKKRRYTKGTKGSEKRKSRLTNSFDEENEEKIATTLRRTAKNNRDDVMEQEAEMSPLSSSPTSPLSSSEDYVETNDTYDDIGVYNYHQHHHLLYNDTNNHILNTNYSTSNNIQNNWEYYYESNRGQRSDFGYNLRNATLSALFYGFGVPSLDYYNGNSFGGSESYYQSKVSLYGNLSTGNVYYQPDDLQRIRENYLKDWIC